MKQPSHQETCPHCGQKRLRNFVSVEPGREMEVFVQCDGCLQFVACYVVTHRTSTDFYQSYVDMMHKGDVDSGAATHKAQEQFQERILQQFIALTGEIEKPQKAQE